MKDFSNISNAHPQYIDNMYRSWLNSPESVEAEWQSFFRGFDFAMSNSNGQAGEATATNGQAIGNAQVSNAVLAKEFAVIALIHGYRDRGHMLSDTNPIKPRKDRKPRLDLADYGLEEADLTKTFVSGFEIGMPNATLSAIIDRLKQIYCGTIGFESTQIHDKERRLWLRQKIESRAISPDFGLSNEKKRRIIEKLNGATIFEQFLHTKFVGQKRFSLEGGEGAIACIDAMINRGADMENPSVEEAVIGMAHRGRLNVLANILGKTYEQIFKEFEGKAPTDKNLAYGSGDVKYHMGYSSQVKSLGGKTVHMKLLPNPSHLEAIDPVVEGYARAKADIMYKSKYDKILPILVHGDAAVAGQGVVYETLQMSGLNGYYTGGSIHLVINNQIGFTTDWEDARTSTYCTSIANVVQAPVFHVNGDDAEAVVFAGELAVEYRQMFNTDVFIDMVCYRKYGHNESDEPRFTQPGLWKLIDAHATPREVYLQKLLQRGEIDMKTSEELEGNFKKYLQERLDEARQKELPYKYQDASLAWKKLKLTMDPADFEQSPETGLSKEVLDQLLKHLTTLPSDFKPLSQIEKLIQAKAKMVEEGKVDWGLGELMAYGSILLEGKDVRMSGQDVRRGTFSHRHVCPVDVSDYHQINRLDNIAVNQGKYRVFNSLLSEYAVLGFEYGYSLATPDSLVVWEAQFGDFVNGAHTIIDQFILSGESKWKRMSGLIMLLPHGYEGQGPEHSSARMERFLQGCAEYNVTIANVTTAANLFHIIRRQLARPFRKPLIIFSPKSILRPPFCISDISEFETGTRFLEVLDDNTAKASKVKKVLVCTGKVYYDLLKKKTEDAREDVAIVRLEQLYPFPHTAFKAILEKYKGAKPTWVQEEPLNMGAWSHLAMNTSEYGWKVVARAAAASPATGYITKHNEEQQQLIAQAFEQ